MCVLNRIVVVIVSFSSLVLSYFALNLVGRGKKGREDKEKKD